MFDALIGTKKTGMRDKDLQTWARVEYKADADYAYYYIKENGIAPNAGASICLIK